MGLYDFFKCFRREPAELPVRDSTEVAIRCIVLRAIIAAANDDNRDEVANELKQNNLWDSVTFSESDFLLTESVHPQWRSDMVWRKEAVLPLLWALQRIDEMPPTTTTCEIDLIEARVPKWSDDFEEFVNNTTLRPAREIHQAQAEALDEHWEVRNETFGGNRPTDNTADVVPERHYALNWLIRYCDQPWDEITCDT